MAVPYQFGPSAQMNEYLIVFHLKDKKIDFLASLENGFFYVWVFSDSDFPVNNLIFIS